jgi:DNA polymerase-3 subunit chi
MRIDFYIVQAARRENRWQFTCRLVEKALSQAKRVMIYCATLPEAQRIDELLWCFREESFIPHGLVDRVDEQLTPVLITTNDRIQPHHDVLINLSLTIPTFFTSFDRLCEIADQEPTVLNHARQRWSSYCQQGYTPQHHLV